LKESDESRIERLSRGKQPLSQVGYTDFIEKFNKDIDSNNNNNTNK